MRSRLIHRSQLSEGQREDMFRLLSCHFVDPQRAVFDADLNAKNWVLLLTDPDTHQLQGFTTLLLYETAVGGKKLNVVYSGDTIVSPAAWRSMRLPQAWIGALNHLRRTYAKDALHWLLLVSGYRTYRFLPVFLRDFHPRFDAATPPGVRDIVRALAQERFGSRYDAEDGVVRLQNPQILVDPLRGIPAARRKDPHVDFFARVNPGHEHGHELVCFTALEESNFTRAGKRMWQAGDKLFGNVEQHA